MTIQHHHNYIRAKQEYVKRENPNMAPYYCPLSLGEHDSYLGLERARYLSLTFLVLFASLWINFGSLIHVVSPLQVCLASTNYCVMLGICVLRHMCSNDNKCSKDHLSLRHEMYHSSCLSQCDWLCYLIGYLDDPQ